MRGIRRGLATTNNRKCRQCPTSDCTRHCFLILFGIAAISASILTIYSCKFFSYKEVDIFQDGYISDADLAYEPFEYLPRAGVGLFSYYMGDTTGKGLVMNDPMCFTYCDEFTDYQWLSSNNAETGGVDIWVLARYSSMFAPIFGLLACLQILVQGVLGCCSSRNGMFVQTQLFLCAAFFQIGTFSVVLASPILYSTSKEDLQQHFCFTESSNVRCTMDTGSMFSLTSVVLYLLLAFASCTMRRPTLEAGRNRTPDGKNDVDRDTDDSSISDISQSASESHSKTEQPAKQSQRISDDEDSVFSTLIQYFSRNQKNADANDETAAAAESDFDIRIGHCINDIFAESSTDEEGPNHTENSIDSVSTLTDTFVNPPVMTIHKPIQNTVITASRPVPSRPLQNTVITASKPKRNRWGRTVTKSKTAASPNGDKYEPASNNETANKKTAGSNQWETESNNSLRELGIQLNRLTPYSASNSYDNEFKR